MANSPSPRTVRAVHTMARIRKTDQTDKSRRQRAARNGYRGPLTRDEYARRNTSQF